MESGHEYPGGSSSSVLDEAVVICHEEASEGRHRLADWLARYPERAGELAQFLADQAHLEEWAGGLREVPLPGVPRRGSPEQESPIGVGGYLLGEELGRGGMGVVFAATDEAIGVEVALKLVRADRLHDLPPEQRQEWLARFRLEARIAQGLEHPHIVPIHQVGEHEGLPYFAMPRIDANLADHLGRLHGRPREAARIVAQVARGVHHAHLHGILHRDLKPANILMTAGGEPRVTDFGLAKRLLDERQSRTGMIVGTFGYMAPEQAFKDKDKPVTWAADIFSLGAILYECLTGQPPFGRGNLADVLARMGQEVPAPSALDPEVNRNLENICLRCLERDPADRYPSAEALAHDLERFLDGGTIARPGPSVLASVREALRHCEPAGALVSWRTACWWNAGRTLVAHLLIFWIVWTGQPAWLLWAICLANYGLHAATTIMVRLRHSVALSRIERHSQVVTGVVLIGHVVLLLAYGLKAPWGSVDWILLWYPAVAVVTALSFFVHGLIHWGKSYIAGGVMMGLALPMAWFPPWAPLISGLAVAGLLGWYGWEMRWRSREYQEQESAALGLAETTAG